MAKIVDSVEALRFVLTATKDDPNIHAFEVPRNVVEDVLSELDRLREFDRVVRVAIVRGRTCCVECIGGEVVDAVSMFDRELARATGGEGT